MSKEAMKLALEALEPFKRMFREVEARHEGGITEANIHCQISVSDLRKCFYAFCDLEEALAKQEQGEPVGGFVQSPYGNYPILQWTDGYIAKMGDKLYTTPQQRTWVGLTDGEKEDCLFSKSGLVMSYEDVVDAVEAKLKEKNNA